MKNKKKKRRKSKNKNEEKILNENFENSKKRHYNKYRRRL